MGYMILYLHYLDNKSNIDELKANLNDLKSAIENPKLYVIKIFDQLRNQVDLCFKEKQQCETSDN